MHEVGEPVLDAVALVEAAGFSPPRTWITRSEVVEAAGIEPDSGDNLILLMAREFGFYCIKTFELHRCFESPRVPSNPLESSPILETFWR
jgi:hypothetical protein